MARGEARSGGLDGLACLDERSEPVAAASDEMLEGGLDVRAAGHLHDGAAAPTWPRGDEALVLEDAQRLSDRAAAKAALLPKVTFVRQRGAFLVDALQNMLTQSAGQEIRGLGDLDRPDGRCAHLLGFR